MRTLHNRKGGRPDGDRQSFAFFLIGAVVVLIAVFLVGIYFGRELEKGGATASDARTYKVGAEATRGEWSVGGGAAAERVFDNMSREVGSFSEEAVRVPVVQPAPPAPPAAAAPPVEVEAPLTFQESLSKKESEPVPLEKPKGRPGPGVSVQAGAFKDREKAQARLERLEKAGFRVRVSRNGKDGKGGLHLVVAGPFPDRDAAREAVRKLKSELKIDAILLNG